VRWLPSASLTLVTSAGTTSYSYDSADVELTSKHDPNGKVTNYTYDANGNLTQSVYDPSGANQQTSYTYDKNNRLTGVTEPNGTSVTFSYDADGNRVSKVVTSGGTTTTSNEVYALGHLDHQTDQNGTILATFTYDTSGEPTSVVVGAPTTGTRYYYVYNGHGDVVALVDSNGTSVASYSYDEFGNLTSSSESLPNGWHNPYRYDGAEGVRYDSETGLYWMSVRAYDPTLGRFLSHDPLGRLAALGFDIQPYVYVGNNPVNRRDPSGMLPGRFTDPGDGGEGNPPPLTTITPTSPPADGGPGDDCDHNRKKHHHDDDDCKPTHPKPTPTQPTPTKPTPTPTKPTPGGNGSGGDACPTAAIAYVHWWFQVIGLYLNRCLISDISTIAGIGGSLLSVGGAIVAAISSAAVAGPVGIALALIGLTIVAYVAWLYIVNNHSGRGACLMIPWNTALPGGQAPWVMGPGKPGAEC
jgi:RHS repeat-associated protein